MKKFYVLVVALLVVSGAMAQWFPQNSGTTNNLNSVYFTDANTGYAVGDTGTIIKTTDGGSNWTEQYSGTNQTLRSVFFWDTMSGYCVGDGGNILKTTDGGENWNVQLVDTNILLNSVYFPSESTGYIAGERTTYVAPFQVIFDAIVLKTTDFGINWSENFITDGLLYSICFPSPEIGYAGGSMPGTPGYDFSLQTEDSGENWTYSDDPGFSKVLFTDIDTGYAISQFGYYNDVIRTSDGGENWEMCTTIGTHYGIISIYFLSNGIGYGVGWNEWGGDGMIFYTNDYGVNWEIQDSTLSNMPYEVYFPVTDTGYIVGEDGLILKTTNGGLPVGVNDLLILSESLKIYPIPSSTTITISTPTTPQKNPTLTIYNLNGQQLVSRQITEQQTVADVSGLPQGVYFVRVADDNGVMVGKFVKQ